MIRQALATFARNITPVLAQSIAIEIILFYDTFTDVNGTLLPSHTPDIDRVGGGWVALTGSFEIASNRAQRTGSGSPRAIAETNESDVIVSSDFNMQANAGISGLLFRHANATSTWIWGWVGIGTQMQLLEQSGGLILRGFYSGYGAGELHNLKVVANGTSLDCQVDDITRVSFTSSTHQSATRHGIVSNSSGAGEYWDNFRIVEAS